jgi:hypothetical protein
MEGGTCIQESYAELDGFAAAALDDTEKEFKHWEQQKKEYKEYCRCGWCCIDWCKKQYVEFVAILSYDMLINFIDCTKAVHKEFETIISEKDPNLTENDQEIMVSVAGQICEELLK